MDLMMQEPPLAVVITWGVTDAHTWLGGGRRPNQAQQARPPQRPLAFDAQNQPTEAFYAVRQSFDT
jgi:GH35 family endo-1,4-beta-xylanase